MEKSMTSWRSRDKINKNDARGSPLVHELEAKKGQNSSGRGDRVSYGYLIR